MFPRGVFLLFCLSAVSGIDIDYIFGPGPDYDEVTSEPSPNILRVYHGEDSNHMQQKHLVELLTKVYLSDGGGFVSQCSGSVISDRWILTAAHCYYMTMADQDISRRVKYLDVIIQRPEHNQRKMKQAIEIARANRDGIKIHERFIYSRSNPRPDFDIAVVKANQPIVFREDLLPIQLERKSLKLGEITTGTIAGYGKSDLDTDNKPREGAVEVKACAAARGRRALCSYEVVAAGGGDSGGSLVSAAGTLLGVTSSSCRDAHLHRVCETTYVDVSQFVDWIEHNTGV